MGDNIVGFENLFFILIISMVIFLLVAYMILIESMMIGELEN
jgi:hypothetical protein